MSTLRRKSKTESGAVMTKREAVKKKPLVERVKWTGKGRQTCALGEIEVRVWKRDHRDTFMMSAPIVGLIEFDSDDIDAAKVDALMIVQKAVLEAAEAWSD